MTESDSPTWLNSSFLEIALRSAEDDPSVKVTSNEVRRATAAGDNYASDMYRATVQTVRGGQTQTYSLIVKAVPANEAFSKLINESNVFERESEAFITVMPAIYRLLEQALPGKYQPYTAKCLYYRRGSPATAIVMEDLKEQGFRMAERTLGLDLQHCLLVIRTIARVHAASAVLHHKHPEMFKPFYDSVYCENMKKALVPFFNTSMRNLANEVEKWPGYNDRIASRLHKIADKAVDFLIRDSVRDDNDFNVFIHGDLWLNNIMFRYCDDTGDAVDIRFVDYQLCHFTNPAQDLQYFLYTSPSSNLLEKHSMLVEEYHNTLGETLGLLGFQHLHPSLKRLNRQLEKKGLFAVLIACTVLPIVLADRSDIPDMEKVMTEGDSVHFSERYKEEIKKLLPLFERKGWLDYPDG